MGARSSVMSKTQIAQALEAVEARGIVITDIEFTKAGMRIRTTAGATGSGDRPANPWDEVLTNGSAQ